MIQEIMERSVVRAAAKRVRGALNEERNVLSQSGGDSPTDGEEVVSPSEIDEVIDRIDEWEAKEAEDLAGGGESAWIPSDPIAGLIQSVVEDYFFESQIVPEPQQSKAVPQHVPISSFHLPPDALSWLKGDAQQAYEGWDPRWISRGAVANMIRAVRGKFPFPVARPPVVEMADRARLIVVGDWGSGLDRAQCVATAMRFKIDEGLKDNRQVHVVHLGDVYYTGFAREYDRKVLRYWPVHSYEASKINSWCLNGNHDMYSGGYGYFDHLLKDPIFAAQGQCSCFSLENKKWMLLGTDTSYAPGDYFGMTGDMTADQAAWVDQTLTRGASQKKKGILFSHHQPLSAYSKDDTSKLRARLQGPLSRGLVHAWFWGHEHRCAFYKSTPEIQYPCLVGHGGVPEKALKGSRTKPDSVIYEHTAFVQSGFRAAYLEFGFAVLDFDDDVISCSFVSEKGATEPESPIQIRA